MHGKCGKQKKGRETTLTTRLRHRVTQKSSLKSLAIFGVLPLASIACERLCSGGGSLICILLWFWPVRAPRQRSFLSPKLSACTLAPCSRCTRAPHVPPCWHCSPIQNLQQRLLSLNESFS